MSSLTWVLQLEESLYQNAGVDLLARKSIEESDMDSFRKILDTNIMSSVLCTQQAFLLMGSQSPKGGRIINNGSISATSPRPSEAAPREDAEIRRLCIHHLEARHLGPDKMHLT